MSRSDVEAVRGRKSVQSSQEITMLLNKYKSFENASMSGRLQK